MLFTLYVETNKSFFDNLKERIDEYSLISPLFIVVLVPVFAWLVRLLTKNLQGAKSKSDISSDLFQKVRASIMRELIYPSPPRLSTLIPHVPFIFLTKYLIKLIDFFSANILSTIAQKIIERRKNSNEQGLINLTVVGLLVGRKAKQSAQCYAFLLSALLFYASLPALFGFKPRAEVGLFIAAFFIILFINQWVLKYRIRKGLYGTNDYEAREILTFIFNHADKSDFSGRSGLKSVMPAPEPDNVYGLDAITETRQVKA